MGLAEDEEKLLKQHLENSALQCGKLHNIANSIIIFDEAQMIPNDYLKPCLSVMEQLLRYYRSTIVLCTSTQPALKSLLSQDVHITELFYL